MYEFKVEKMNCKSCLMNIQDALEELHPDLKAEADFSSKVLKVEGPATPEQIAKAIEEAGYPVQRINN